MSRPAAYDLHLHSVWSYDALAEVEPYFCRAEELGVRAIAVTEHHNLDSITETLAAAARHPRVRMIPAAELTVTTSIGPVDLLCYGLPLRPGGRLREVLESYNAWQRACGAAWSRGMQAIGYPYDDAERLALLRSYRPERTIARQGATHVKNGIQRAHFLRRGYMAREEDYAEISRRAQQGTPRPPYPAAGEVLPAVKETGALVVIAHPVNYFLRNDLPRMEALRRECALDGIECAHRSTPPELTAFYRQYCRERGMVSTGGSDCHESGDLGDPPGGWGHVSGRVFASHIGEEGWLDELLERLPRAEGMG